MFGAAEILMMQQLTMSNNHSTYRRNTGYDSSSSATLYDQHKTKNMFLQLHEVLVNGTVQEITVNFSYVKSFRPSKYRTGEFVDNRWVDKELIEVTQLTLIDGNDINVHESSGYIHSVLKY